MTAVAVGLTIVGVALNLAGSLWLLFGFSPDDERYTKGGTYDGSFPGVANLLRDQRRVSGLVVAGTALQLLALVLIAAD